MKISYLKQSTITSEPCRFFWTWTAGCKSQWHTILIKLDVFWYNLHNCIILHKLLSWVFICSFVKQQQLQVNTLLCCGEVLCGHYVMINANWTMMNCSGTLSRNCVMLVDKNLINLSKLVWLLRWRYTSNCKGFGWRTTAAATIHYLFMYAILLRNYL